MFNVLLLFKETEQPEKVNIGVPVSVRAGWTDPNELQVTLSAVEARNPLGAIAWSVRELQLGQPDSVRAWKIEEEKS